MSKNGIEEPTTAASAEDTSVEDLVWSLMSKSGFLSQLKGQIGKFVQENGNIDSSQCINPSRANTELLSAIYEYLHYLGLKNTCGLLLSESPVKVNVVNQGGLGGDESIPILLQMFERMKNGPEALNSFVNESTLLNMSSTPGPGSNKTYVKSVEPLEEEEEEDLYQNAVDTTHRESAEISGQSRESIYSTPPTDFPMPPPPVDHLVISMPITPSSANTTKHDEEAEKTIKEEESLPTPEKDAPISKEVTQSFVESEKELDESDNTMSTPPNKGENEPENPPITGTPEEEALSLSELLEGLNLNNTMDYSINSESKGLSSCDHYVKLGLGGSLRKSGVPSLENENESIILETKDLGSRKSFETLEQIKQVEEEEGEEEGEDSEKVKPEEEPNYSKSREKYEVQGDFEGEKEGEVIENKTELNKSEGGKTSDGDISFSDLLGEIEMEENTVDYSIGDQSKDLSSCEHQIKLN